MSPTALVLVLLVAVSVLGERPSRLGAVGAVVIVAGIVVIAFPAAGIVRDGVAVSLGWASPPGSPSPATRCGTPTP